MNMKSILKTAVTILAAATLVLAADKPNFSGDWKADMTRSEFGGPGPDSLTRKIQHAEPSLIMTDAQSSALGEDKAERNYTTDGKETSYHWMGGDVKSAAHWEGATMVIVGKVNAGGIDVVVSGTLTLSDDGKTLTELDKIVAGGNEVGGYKIVFVKQ